MLPLLFFFPLLFLGRHCQDSVEMKLTLLFSLFLLFLGHMAKFWQKRSLSSPLFFFFLVFFSFGRKSAPLPSVATLTLGSWPKQRLAKVWAKSEAWESHFMLMGVWESVKEWTSTLPSELPLWELESWWTPESSKSDCRGKNPLEWIVTYIIENFLERRCLKWSTTTHLGTQNTSYGQKKGHESNCQFDSRPLKVRNHLDLLACRWRVIYRWKALDNGYNFCSHKVMGFQNHESPNFENFGIIT